MSSVLAVVVAVCAIGLSTLLWSAAGIARLIAAARPRVDALVRPSMFFRTDEVAVLIAAHDEERLITDAIVAARRLVPARNVFVVSDGSSDATVALAEAAGATVHDLRPNRGKAGALRAGLRIFRLPARFPLVLFLDADSRPRADYLHTALPLFADPGVVAVAGRATTAPGGALRPLGRLLTSYRERTYLLTQYLHKFGQAAPTADAVAIVPGFASLYRTDILERIDIDAPGLCIEDFNMTFEVHAKRLGRIAFDPDCAVAETQDPTGFGDYAAQVRRWCLGFWQTVRRHRARPGLFWGALGLFVAETVVSSILLLLVPLAVAVAAGSSLVAVLVPGPAGEAARAIADAVPAGALLLGFVAADAALTLFACALARRWPRPGVLLYPALRVVDAFLCLRALLAAFGRPSDGRWRSPRRRGSVSEERSVRAAQERHQVHA
jgi:poly-beta-1,6-N-acetyl-D-glucosamine synthase